MIIDLIRSIDLRLLLMSGATFILDDLVTIVKLLLPSSGALILPIPSRQSLKQVLAGKILQLLLLFLPVEGVPQLHPVPKILENLGFRFFFIENPRLRLPEDHG